jgi:hypothetical protein
MANEYDPRHEIRLTQKRLQYGSINAVNRFLETARVNIASARVAVGDADCYTADEKRRIKEALDYILTSVQSTRDYVHNTKG